jgi:hypothetical protein
MKTNIDTGEFRAFKKIPRLFRDIIITEKLDGTNAQLYIEDIPYQEYTSRQEHVATVRTSVYADNGFGPDGFVRVLRAGSRTRWITPENDNFGFAAWAYDNANELLQLGPGHHFGEWWGRGVQRGYGLTERRFSLFNTTRWEGTPPAPCSVVPVLYSGVNDTAAIVDALCRLREGGSLAAPGYMNPEGIIVYHVASNYLFKVTLDNDGTPKSTLQN